jgi:hypothetical protein
MLMELMEVVVQDGHGATCGGGCNDVHRYLNVPFVSMIYLPTLLNVGIP